MAPRSAGDARSVALTTITDRLLSIQVAHPTRVAIDGRSAAGKTTLADELAAEVRTHGRDVIRASIDDFHRPGHKFRSQRREWTPQTYYDVGYDYQAFRELLLQPLGPHGNRRCRTALFDAYHDVWMPEDWRIVSNDTIAIIDGAFLMRPEFANDWDYIIWVDIDMQTMVERARQRDVAWVGSEEVVIERYRTHWIPTHELYERLTEPARRAHSIIDNRNVQAPVIVKLASA